MNLSKKISVNISQETENDIKEIIKILKKDKNFKDYNFTMSEVIRVAIHRYWEDLDEFYENTNHINS